MDINTALNHLYLVNPSVGSIEVRNGSTGALIATFSLAAFGATLDGAMAVGYNPWPNLRHGIK